MKDLLYGTIARLLRAAGWIYWHLVVRHRDSADR
ncbi:hypothetical protein J2S41_002085 [Catenuloplanes atrovinosus]|uniref:Uncharacterized protein n=1 Tax=Catenuloplanes atrovinosus TaxID=137266 RepID=A0AAE4C933_9ACTN|nr:hypothetical protein [Catenuloplanes atrovinosus]